ncbi:hypothetical protein RHSIM_Rhsim09G0118100 [Rhododendron simsii]|uniref:Uncharacterized protein n=1 Tax=Rhododendron simsii TaxID=118357 RepID=A0A834GDW5_RHOSS|nr:hypothetical protein RHSIM_Rhsim09G0118100 [Rhododendron simsii]
MPEQRRITETKFSTTSITHPKLSVSILCLTAATAAVLQLIPYDQSGPYRVPKRLFKGHPSVFHAFLVSVMFAFSGALSALFLQSKPNMARVCSFYSSVSIASAVGLLIWCLEDIDVEAVTFLDALRWARGKGFSKLKVLTDCLVLVQALRSMEHANVFVKPVIRNIPDWSRSLIMWQSLTVLGILEELPIILLSL